MRNKSITVNMDIESSPTVMSNLTAGILPFKGYKPGEMVYWVASTPTGKSMMDNSMVLTMLKNRGYMKEEKPKYQFSRTIWYEASLIGIRPEQVSERIEWCEQTFGPLPKNPDAWSRWYVSYNKIRIRDQEDFSWYTLRWS